MAKTTGHSGFLLRMMVIDFVHTYTNYFCKVRRKTKTRILFMAHNLPVQTRQYCTVQGLLACMVIAQAMLQGIRENSTIVVTEHCTLDLLFPFLFPTVPRTRPNGCNCSSATPRSRHSGGWEEEKKRKGKRKEKARGDDGKNRS